MIEVVWHIPREVVAKVRTLDECLVCSSFTAIFDRKERFDRGVLVPTELATAVNLRQVRQKLLDVYEDQFGEPPHVLLTVYRYPAGKLEKDSPIGVGMGGFSTLDLGSMAEGRVEVIYPTMD